MTDDRNPYALPERAELSNIAHQEPPSSRAPLWNSTRFERNLRPSTNQANAAYFYFFLHPKSCVSDFNSIDLALHNDNDAISAEKDEWS